MNMLLEAEPVGLGHVVDEALVALAVLEADAALGPRAAEQSELHVVNPPAPEQFNKGQGIPWVEIRPAP